MSQFYTNNVEKVFDDVLCALIFYFNLWLKVFQGTKFVWHRDSRAFRTKEHFYLFDDLQFLVSNGSGKYTRGTFQKTYFRNRLLSSDTWVGRRAPCLIQRDEQINGGTRWGQIMSHKIWLNTDREFEATTRKGGERERPFHNKPFSLPRPLSPLSSVWLFMVEGLQILRSSEEYWRRSSWHHNSNLLLQRDRKFQTNLDLVCKSTSVDPQSRLVTC